MSTMKNTRGKKRKNASDSTVQNPTTCSSNNAQGKMRNLKRSATPEDLPDTEPGFKVAEDQQDKEASFSRKIHCSDNILANQMINEVSASSTTKRSNKRLRVVDEQWSDGAPPSKKSNHGSGFFLKLGQGLKKAMSEISSSMKDAIENPGTLAKEVKQYSNKFATDLTDAAEELADKVLSPTSKKILEDSEKAILKGMQMLSHQINVTVMDCSEII